MPPKNKSLKDLVSGISAQLETISEQLQAVRDRQDKQDEKFERLEKLLDASTTENIALKKENAELKSDVLVLKEKVNNLEQRNRAVCTRIFDLPIAGDAADNNNVAVQLYQKLLFPILSGAKDSGKVKSIPNMSDTIETAHILPGPKPNKPILCRFKTPFIKQLIMQGKKEFAPRGPSRGDKPGPLLYPIFHDITRDSYLLMKKLGSDERVQASWFDNGAIRFRLTNSDAVRRVHNIYGPYDDLFN